MTDAWDIPAFLRRTPRGEASFFAGYTFSSAPLPQAGAAELTALTEILIEGRARMYELGFTTDEVGDWVRR